MRVRFLSLTLVAALAACGGSSNNNNTNTGGGALTARTLQGEITSVDSSSSITVNGVKTDDSAAKVVVDDNPSTHDQLKVGQVVTVTIDDNGKTTEIHARPEVRGSIDDASKTTSSFTVGGQTVRVDDSTHFEDSTRLAGIAAGQRVRVSGYPDDKGGLRATRIDRDASASSDFELHGVASAVSGNGFTLTVGTTTYTVTLASGTLPATVVNGAFVEVKSATKPSGTAITASSVKVDDDSKLGDAGHEAEVEGIVLTVTNAGTTPTFTIRSRTVTTSSSTKWVGGAPADLIVGVKAEAEGALDAAGNIAASKVVFKDSLRFQSTVSNVVLAAVTDAKNGTFKMLGGTLTVHVSDVTEFESGVTDLSSLTTQNIEVRGYQTVAGSTATGAGANDIVATRIKLGSGGGGGGTSTRVVIQGPIAGLDATAKTFQILGYTINASTASSLSRDDSTSVSDLFTAGLANGMVVKARGDSAGALVGTTLTAKEIELEDDK